MVATVRAVLQCLGPDAAGGRAAGVPHLDVAPGAVLDPTEFVRRLVEFGYRREHQVEHRGEAAVRGGIIDVFASTADVPVRIDLWGDEVERLTEFAVNDQRSVATLPAVRIYPARELRPDDGLRRRAAAQAEAQPWARDHFERIAAGEMFDGMESWMPWLLDDQVVLPDLLGPDAAVVLVEPRRLRDRALEIAAEAEDLTRSLSVTWGLDGGAGPAADGTSHGFPLLHVGFERLMQRCDSALATITGTADTSAAVGTSAADTSGGTSGGRRRRGAEFATTAWEPIAGDSARLLNQLRDLVAGTAGTVLVAAEGPGSARRIADSLGAESIPLSRAALPPAGAPAPLPAPRISLRADAGGHVVVAPLNHSFIAPSVGVAVLCEADLSGRRRTHRVARRRTRAESSFEDLEAGDFVVHHHHGIARFAGLVHRSFGAAARDYLELEFRGTDRIYLPTDRIELIRPYAGGEAPALSRMGGAEFQRQKARVRSAVAEIAQELVVLYQRRLTVAGHRFDASSPWLDELADSFPYVATPDQQAAIDDVLADMAADTPMDRLVCGDVGFGKTEIAVRAAFCAVAGGKQAAVLVPTTLLAQQHHQTFAERLSGHAVRVEVLSRFLTPAQQRAVVGGVADGSVDVVIGTHRLLSGDVRFADLGLLVIDEEQRFGVAHKESMKHLKADVDVLTLTATPIPRTLEMSLTGIRDMSVLNTPPEERRPILTHVAPYDERAVSEALRRELLREGQVFFVHNRVADIDDVADGLRRLVPEARIAVAHGQMDEGTLETIVIDFWEGRYDVLVCTTIIESGIDMPSVNTLVVDRADRMGLGQLHQIRGRVGRSSQRAYAYLFYPENHVLTEEAYERLRTIGESTELGSGYRIAMRDLQLRGAGNLLGGVQSGHIASVGYDLYCEMVSEAFAELRGEPRAEPAEISIELPVKAYLSEEYVPRSDQRLEAYRRLGAVTDLVEVADLEAEWLDRYGPVPPEAQTLLHVGLLRTECVRLGMRSVAFAARAAIAADGVAGERSAGRVTLAPLELSPAEQVRLERVGRSGGFATPRYKPSGDPDPAAVADAEVQLGVARVDATLPGRIFALTTELRQPPPPPPQ
ncbi:MAG TPA: transcription-repair coupling factor, partial [Acidimicrobiaceae bacterium]|nr:transcription-repair coupling factor [Acidimicrobiaceae bacterium]